MREFAIIPGALACLDGQQQWLIRVVDVGETDSLVVFDDMRRQPQRVGNDRIKARPSYQQGSTHSRELDVAAE